MAVCEGCHITWGFWAALTVKVSPLVAIANRNVDCGHGLHTPLAATILAKDVACAIELYRTLPLRTSAVPLPGLPVTQAAQTRQPDR
jgi:hypothetical protein